MKHYVLNLTTNCQNDCLFCDFKYPPIQGIKFYKTNHLELLGHNKIKNSIVSLGGGEPTLNKDLVKIVKQLKQNNNYVELISNGQKLSDIKFLENLIKSGIDRFCVSLHSINKNNHEFLTRNKSSFSKTWTGILNLVRMKHDKKYDINIIYVLNHYNLKDLAQTLYILNHLGKLNFQINLVHTKKLQLFVNLLNMRAEFFKIDLDKVKNITIHLYGFTQCLIPKSWRKFISDFKNNDKIISTEECNFNHKQLVRLARIKSSACKKCIYNSKCCGIWKTYSGQKKLLKPIYD